MTTPAFGTLPGSAPAAVDGVEPAVWLVSGYALFLVGVGYGFDLLARRVARHSQGWRTGAFRYHADHDAWVCPQDQWLWPVSYDPGQRVMRYRAAPTVCNACPIKRSCTDSATGREIARAVDPWPHSEAGRFHRGMACGIALLGVAMPLTAVAGYRGAVQISILLGTALTLALASWPLARHLHRAPSNFPEPALAPSGAGLGGGREPVRRGASDPRALPRYGSDLRAGAARPESDLRAGAARLESDPRAGAARLDRKGRR